MFLHPIHKLLRSVSPSKKGAPQPYRYQKLASVDEIRLITIQPGTYDDPIKIEISHVPFGPQEDREDRARRLSRSHQLTLNDLRGTLPKGWVAHEAMNGHFLFENTLDKSTSWKHPDPNYDLRQLPQVWPAVAPAFEPKFEALSYVWGSRKILQEIEVISKHQIPEVATLSIRQSLADALRHLRDRRYERVMWIDAICINQNDVQERNAQVEQMWRIFQQASQTIAWLGRAGNDSDLALNTLANISSQVAVTTAYHIFASPGARNLEFSQKSYDIPIQHAAWEAILDLIKRPYFDRLWIIPELELSDPRVFFQCGHKKLKLSDLASALHCIYRKDHEPCQGLFVNIAYARATIESLSFDAFTVLLNTYRFRVCSDPRDKIYALRSLASSDLQREILVDYEKPVEDVYQFTFISLCKFYRRIDLLGLCRSEPRTIRGPSWVPDFSTPSGRTRAYNFSSGFSCSEIVQPSRHVLRVVGKRCCTVGNISSVVSEHFVDILRMLHDWLSVVSDTNDYPAGGTVLEAITATICLNKFRERWPYSSCPLFSEIAFDLHPRLSSRSSSLGADDFSSGKFSKIKSRIRHQRFFRSTEGHFGLAPDSVQKNDVVCSFLGCGELILLRPVGRNQFRVIGDCYAHGFHDGIAFLGPLPEHWRVVFYNDDHDGFSARFRNDSTNEETVDDPRLGGLPEHWEWTPLPRTKEDPEFFEKFRHSIRGDIMNSDPRMLPDALKARGVHLETFELV